MWSSEVKTLVNFSIAWTQFILCKNYHGMWEKLATRKFDLTKFYNKPRFILNRSINLKFYTAPDVLLFRLPIQKGPDRPIYFKFSDNP